MTYEEAQQYLLEIPRFTKKNPAENTRAFIEFLNEKLGCASMGEENHVIHVAGTNGKGSVCAFLNGILTEAGYTVGMFTSPHLVSMTERFRINGECISEKAFTHAFEVVKDVVEEGVLAGMFSHPTFFEYLVGMAHVIFRTQKVDYVILETGLGGRLDATNVVKKPLLTILTSIGYDHTEFLGETIEEIAMEKAGIIKEGVPVIFDGNQEVVNKVIYQKAVQLNAPIYEISMKNCKNVNFGKKNIDFLLESEYYKKVSINLASSAEYQVMNAALAVIAAQTILKDRACEKILAEGIRRVQWPGRMEWIEDNFLIDGAHNEAGIKQILAGMRQLPGKKGLLYTAVADKNYEKMIRMLCEYPWEYVVVTQLDSPRAAKAEELRQIFVRYGRSPVYVEMTVQDGINKAHDLISDEEIILATGSLYLVGEIKKQMASSALVRPR